LSATIENTVAVQTTMNFQYPQPDRIVCNTCADQSLVAILRTFSIRNRIELSATPLDAVGCVWSAGFQYPQPDRIVCNQGLTNRQIALRFFQYPQPDRIVCNTVNGDFS